MHFHPSATGYSVPYTAFFSYLSLALPSLDPVVWLSLGLSWPLLSHSAGAIVPSSCYSGHHAHFLLAGTGPSSVSLSLSLAVRSNMWGSSGFVGFTVVARCVHSIHGAHQALTLASIALCGRIPTLFVRGHRNWRRVYAGKLRISGSSKGFKSTSDFAVSRPSILGCLD